MTLSSFRLTKIIAYISIFTTFFLNSFFNISLSTEFSLYTIQVVIFSAISSSFYSYITVFSMGVISTTKSFKNVENKENAHNVKKRIVSYIVLFFCFIVSSNSDFIFRYLSPFAIEDVIATLFTFLIRSSVSAIVIISLLLSISINVGRQDEV